LVALKRWLSVLVAPGSSLGGARPKANFLEADKTAWIAKFPAMDDDIDVGAWEGLTHALAINAGVNMPTAKIVNFGTGFHTFCVQRFDRSAAGRVFYASAMTMLHADQSEGASYLDIAQFLQANGASDHQENDLAQLFRRVAFNIAVGNRDDHLRNHGFLMTKDGWRLAPAFDVNPNPHKATHVLNIDEHDNRPDIQSLIDTAYFYGLSDANSQDIVDEVLVAVAEWRTFAKRMQISSAEVETMASVILAFDDDSCTSASKPSKPIRFGP
jgi:serine/threonine-protein kinase HipA